MIYYEKFFIVIIKIGLITSRLVRKKYFKNSEMALDKIGEIYYNVNIAGLCNGSMADSDSVCMGSNPIPAAKTPWKRL